MVKVGHTLGEMGYTIKSEEGLEQLDIQWLAPGDEPTLRGPYYRMFFAEPTSGPAVVIFVAKARFDEMETVSDGEQMNMSVHSDEVLFKLGANTFHPHLPKDLSEATALFKSKGDILLMTFEFLSKLVSFKNGPWMMFAKSEAEIFVLDFYADELAIVSLDEIIKMVNNSVIKVDQTKVKLLFDIGSNFLSKTGCEDQTYFKDVQMTTKTKRQSEERNEKSSVSSCRYLFLEKYSGHSTENKTCDICSKVYSNKEEIIRHIERDHLPVQVLKFQNGVIKSDELKVYVYKLREVFRQFLGSRRKIPTSSLISNLNLYCLINDHTKEHLTNMIKEIHLIQSRLSLDSNQCPYEGCYKRFKDVELVVDHFGKYHYQAMSFVMNMKGSKDQMESTFTPLFETLQIPSVACKLCQNSFVYTNIWAFLIHVFLKHLPEDLLSKGLDFGKTLEPGIGESSQSLESIKDFSSQDATLQMSIFLQHVEPIIFSALFGKSCTELRKLIAGFDGNVRQEREPEIANKTQDGDDALSPSSAVMGEESAVISPEEALKMQLEIERIIAATPQSSGFSKNTQVVHHSQVRVKQENVDEEEPSPLLTMDMPLGIKAELEEFSFKQENVMEVPIKTEPELNRLTEESSFRGFLVWEFRGGPSAHWQPFVTLSDDFRPDSSNLAPQPLNRTTTECPPSTSFFRSDENILPDLRRGGNINLLQQQQEQLPVEAADAAQSMKRVPAAAEKTVPATKRPRKRMPKSQPQSPVTRVLRKPQASATPVAGPSHGRGRGRGAAKAPKPQNSRKGAMKNVPTAISKLIPRTIKKIKMQEFIIPLVDLSKDRRRKKP